MKIRITEEKALFLVVGLKAIEEGRILSNYELEIYEAAIRKLTDKTNRLVRDIKAEAEYEEKKNNVA